MQEFRDYSGQVIRLTDERLEHIHTHPRMASFLAEIPGTLADPERVVRSRSDPDVRLYYRFCQGTVLGDKYLCIVVKSLFDDSFIITAYVTDTIKRGEILWTRNP